jgi:hypothetical protein
MKLYIPSVITLYIKIEVEFRNSLKDPYNLLLLLNGDRRANVRSSTFGDDIVFMPIEAYTIVLIGHQYSHLVTITNQYYESRKIGLTLHEYLIEPFAIGTIDSDLLLFSKRGLYCIEMVRIFGRNWRGRAARYVVLVLTSSTRKRCQQILSGDNMFLPNMSNSMPALMPCNSPASNINLPSS